MKRKSAALSLSSRGEAMSTTSILASAGVQASRLAQRLQFARVAGQLEITRSLHGGGAPAARHPDGPFPVVDDSERHFLVILRGRDLQRQVQGGEPDGPSHRIAPFRPRTDPMTLRSPLDLCAA